MGDQNNGRGLVTSSVEQVTKNIVEKARKACVRCTRRSFATENARSVIHAVNNVARTGSMAP